MIGLKQMRLIMESPAEFTTRANALLRAAIAASNRHDEGNLVALNRCMNAAKTLKMTWVEGLRYAIDTLK
jgi:hypothetical protein